MGKIFSIIGNNFFERQGIIEKIKSKISKSTLDTFIFFSYELSLSKFREEIFSFSLEKAKLLIFKDAFNLSPDIKNFFIKNFNKIPQNNYIIFEIDNYLSKDIFFDFIFKNTTVLRISNNQNNYIEMLKKSIKKRNLPLALYSLNNLFNLTTNKNLATQILGILVNEIFYINDFLKQKKFFNYLFKLDREIKESLIEPKVAIELALVKILNG